jgi:hypothetical protein
MIAHFRGRLCPLLVYETWCRTERWHPRLICGYRTPDLGGPHNHRIDGVERPVLPLSHLLDDGALADQIKRDADPYSSNR